MYIVEQITADPRQKQSLILADGSVVKIQIRFAPMQTGWFIDRLEYGDFVLTGLRICNSPNMLHQFKNQIPFGLACFSTNDREPSLQLDFISTNSKLYVLSADEVALYDDYLQGLV